MFIDASSSLLFIDAWRTSLLFIDARSSEVFIEPSQIMCQIIQLTLIESPIDLSHLQLMLGVLKCLLNNPKSCAKSFNSH